MANPTGSKCPDNLSTGAAWMCSGDYPNGYCLDFAKNGAVGRMTKSAAVQSLAFKILNRLPHTLGGSHLETLHLGQNALGVRGGEEIGQALTKNRTLTSLDFSSNMPASEPRNVQCASWRRSALPPSDGSICPQKTIH